jgi:hypothetical protein
MTHGNRAPSGGGSTRAVSLLTLATPTDSDPDMDEAMRRALKPRSAADIRREIDAAWDERALQLKGLDEDQWVGELAA